MFSVRQKREIADAVQKILRGTNHPELPKGEIQFELRISGAEDWSWAYIRNNGAATEPGVNPWNEAQDKPHTVTDHARYTGAGSEAMTSIPVSVIEFAEDGKAIWIHDKQGIEICIP